MMWKSVNNHLGQLSLNLSPLCSTAEGHRTKVPWTRFYTRTIRFVLSSLVHITDRGTQLVNPGIHRMGG